MTTPSAGFAALVRPVLRAGLLAGCVWALARAAAPGAGPVELALAAGGGGLGLVPVHVVSHESAPRFRFRCRPARDAEPVDGRPSPEPAARGGYGPGGGSAPGGGPYGVPW